MDTIHFECSACGRQLEAPQDMAGRPIDCPSCKNSIEISNQKCPGQAGFVPQKSGQASYSARTKPPVLGILRKRKTNVGGLLVELVGLILCFVAFPTGLIVGIPILVVGVKMSLKYVCSVCGNRVEDKDVRMCPVCKVLFK